MKFSLIKLLLLWAVIWLAQAGQAREPSPFRLTASLDTNVSTSTVLFAFEVPPGHMLYADHLHFLNDKGDELVPVGIPVPVAAADPITGQEKHFYDRAFVAAIRVDAPLPASLVVKFQGCSNSACYFPERHDFVVSASGVTTAAVPEAPAVTGVAQAENGATDWTQERAGFKVVSRQTGYLVPPTS